MNILSKIADFLSATPILVFVICALLLGTQSFPEVESETLVAKWICWPMAISIVLGFVLKVKADPGGQKAHLQILSLMPLMGYVWFLFHMFA